MLKRETKKHHRSARINEIAPRNGEPSPNAVKLDSNVTTPVRETVTKLTLAQRLHFDVIVVGRSVDTPLNYQIPLARHPPCFHKQFVALQFYLENSRRFQIVIAPLVICLFGNNAYNESTSDGAVQYILQYVSREVLPLIRYGCCRCTLRKRIKINVTEAACPSSVSRLPLFLGSPRR